LNSEQQKIALLPIIDSCVRDCSSGYLWSECCASRYFLTSGYFRFILTSGVGSWSSGSRTSLISFCRYFYFLWEYSFQSIFYFRLTGSTLLLRPSRARDLVIMVEDDPAPGRVTAGIGAVSRGAGTESDLLDRSVQRTLRFGSESISTTGNY